MMSLNWYPASGFLFGDVCLVSDRGSSKVERGLPLGAGCDRCDPESDTELWALCVGPGDE
ncbi:MAG: hypothetical protein IMZ46_13950 [Acidobacteria bacterium]|nr:hypothetical protein [Acidobacteriota bacterium]